MFNKTRLMRISMDSTHLKVDTLGPGRTACSKVSYQQDYVSYMKSLHKILSTHQTLSNLKWKDQDENHHIHPRCTGRYLEHLAVVMSEKSRPLICILAASQEQPNKIYTVYKEVMIKRHINVPAASNAPHVSKISEWEKGFQFNWSNSKQITGCYLQFHIWLIHQEFVQLSWGYCTNCISWILRRAAPRHVASMSIPSMVRTVQVTGSAWLRKARCH